MKIIRRYGSLIVFVSMVLVITYLNALSLKQDEKKDLANYGSNAQVSK